MKVKRLSCSQFAGLVDRSVSFENGVNVVFGKNESGKSTMVNLMSRTLFQNAKVSKRSKQDKEFQELYFPSAQKGSRFLGDYIDGEICFETERGTYTLSKEWGDSGSATLSTPEGKIRNQSEIDGQLKELLGYGEGVYKDILFTSQYHSSTALRELLGAEKTDSKAEITNAVSQAFVEMDGVSMDAIEAAIESQIDALVGKHWDIERERPSNNRRYSTGCGMVHKAYNALEDAKDTLEMIQKLEDQADQNAQEYASCEEELRCVEEYVQDFQSFATLLTIQAQQKSSVKRLQSDITKYQQVLSEWPQLENNLTIAQSLYQEKRNREVLDQYELVKTAQRKQSELDWEALKLECPTDAEIRQLKNTQQRIMALENKLCQMNLQATIRQLGDHSVEIRSLRTGKTLDISGETAVITEAVTIKIPGVMEMQLAPANVNVDEIEIQLRELRNKETALLNRYQIQNSFQMEELANRVNTAKSAQEKTELELKNALGKTNMPELEAAVAKVKDPVRSIEQIEFDIRKQCGTLDVAAFILQCEAKIKLYQEEYTAVDDLKTQVIQAETELAKAKEDIAAAGDVPLKYQGIQDPAAYLEQLNNIVRKKRAYRDQAFAEKTASAAKLAQIVEQTEESGDPREAVRIAMQHFEEQKELLRHWLHISQVFYQQKEELHNNPMQDISDSFTHYLSMISGGNISSEFPDPEKLNISIYSGNSLMDYGKLSEGTKETVSLAFRLAVLDHLFPDGGGVIVFDDPFTDMDAYRTAQACELIRECAERHQVIFLTCKEEYADMFRGNKIRM